MALREELERSGNWLFRWRSYLPLFLIAPCVLAFNEFPQWRRCDEGPDAWGLVCLAVSLLGLAVRVATVGFVPKGTSGRNTHDGQIAETLNTTGIYSLVRNPLYLGNFIIWLGVSMFPLQWWLPVIFGLVFWLYYERIIYAEEEFLRKKFGEQYLRWADQTPAFLPKLTGWRPPALPFSLRSVLRREYSGLLGIVVCFYLLEIGAHWVFYSKPDVHPVWHVVFLSGAAAWVTLRTLKKTTSVLAIEGR